MRLLLDENVHLSLVSILTQEGHDVKHVINDFDPSALDFDILELATRDHRVLVTNDRDFGALVYGQGASHAGIIYLRLRRLPFEAQLAVIREALVFQESHPGRFTVVTTSGVR